ncbi:hypothetical protein [Marinomonas sp. 2405UD68-3]|uniref:hypothetical protein n=1 Tax=Marinomonas sp. 2405UD68-3 TaxID=3391835 RepID=UPI0039C9512D
MTTYCKYNGPELFEDFELSELTQTKFCKQRSINPKYFNIKFNQLCESKFDCYVWFAGRLQKNMKKAWRSTFETPLFRLDYLE